MARHFGDILILGLGTSGGAVARYCISNAALRTTSLTVLDSNSDEKVSELVDSLAKQAQQVNLTFDAHIGSNDIPEAHYSLCVISPGIAPHSDLFKSATRLCDEVISEIEFAWRESAHRWVAITGTNGKTTTTALTTHLLNAGGVEAVSVGNIGEAATDAVAKHGTDVVLVAEVSSFQLATTSEFAPKVAALLNITPDHIDWHGSMQSYAEDKYKIFEQATSETTVVLNLDDPYFDQAHTRALNRGAQVIPITTHSTEMIPVLKLSEGELVALDSAGVETSYGEFGALHIKGAHNASNALFAIAIAREFSLTQEKIMAGLLSFEPVEHRLQFVGKVGEAEWYNDSKATNPDAAFKALDSFPGRQVTLLVGGRNKGNTFDELAKFAQERCKAVLCFGEAGPAIHEATKRIFSTHGRASDVVQCETMLDAMAWAADHTSKDEVVLLSPACASFDEFKSYGHRGDVFATYVRTHALEEAER